MFANSIGFYGSLRKFRAHERLTCSATHPFKKSKVSKTRPKMLDGQTRTDADGRTWTDRRGLTDARRLLDVFGCIRMLEGCWMYSDASGCVRTFSEFFGKFRIFSEFYGRVHATFRPGRARRKEKYYFRNVRREAVRRDQVG